ncbi:MAG: nuclear transport factor 2 family protein [Ilumatobacteraceae bacterium]
MSIDLDGLVRLEAAVWQALVDGDAAADARLLSDDFVGVYPTGVATRADHVDQLAGGATVATFSLEGARMVPVSDDAALLVYLATYVRPGATEPESMYVSSLWCRRDGRWLNTFSQDTPATGERVV